MQPVTRFRIFGLRLGLATLILYWLLIFIGTHLPKLPAAARSVDDKVAHFVAFFVLATLLCYVTNMTNVWRRFGFIIGLCLLYAAIDELSQGMVRGRQTDFDDFLADAAGTISAVTCYVAAKYWWLKRTRSSPKSRGVDPPAA